MERSLRCRFPWEKTAMRSLAHLNSYRRNASALADEDLVAVGVGEGEDVAGLFGFDVFVAQVASGFSEIRRLQRETGEAAERGGIELDLFAGVAGQVQGHGLAGQRLHGELIDVEHARGFDIDHGERD